MFVKAKRMILIAEIKIQNSLSLEISLSLSFSFSLTTRSVPLKTETAIIKCHPLLHFIEQKHRLTLKDLKKLRRCIKSAAETDRPCRRQPPMARREKTLPLSQKHQRI